MTTVGLVGGLGPESTIDYYRRILEAWSRQQPGSAPSIVIDSLDAQLALHLVAEDRSALVEYLFASVRRLIGAGADFVAMTANTAHIVFDELASRASVPMLSIVEVCASEAQRRGMRRLLLLGTRFTMEASFFPDVCARFGIVVVTPDSDERAWLHQRYVGELLRGEFRDDTRDAVIELVHRMRDEHNVDGVVLGGTELPLLLPPLTIGGLPTLDTTALHVATIVARLRSGPPLRDRSSIAPSAPSALRAAWVAAVRSGDANALRDLLDDDYEVWAHGAEALRGPDAAVAAMRRAFDRFDIDQGFEPTETVVAGEWAFERGIERMTVTPRGGGPSQTRSQRAMLVLRRGNDGRWRYARGMTNGLP